MASNEKTKTPPTIKPNKTSLISGCFGFELFHKEQLASNQKKTKNPPTIKLKKTSWISGCFGFESFHTEHVASNQKKTENPPTIKPGRTNWISGCFGFGSFHTKRAVADQSVEGLIKRPWYRKKNKTAATVATEKVVEEASTGGTVVEVNQTSVPDNQSQKPHGSIGYHIKESDCANDITVACQNQSSLGKRKSIKKNVSSSLKIKIDRPKPEEAIKPEERSGSTDPLSKQSRPKNMHKSHTDARVAMSVLVVILVIMLLCGRLCAILCTSVWFYCMPQLVKTTKNINNAQEGTNSSLDSAIDRKNVVLKGFLERKHKVFARIS